MSRAVKISELYENLPSYLEGYAAHAEYPWELICKIEKIIEEILREGLEGYKFLSDGVIVGEDVRISQSAKIEAPALIGARTEIRHGAYLRGNVIIGESCVIGNSSEIKSSILLDRVQAPHYNYVGNSMLGSRVHLGAGAICSNLKSGGSNVVVHADKEYETEMRKLGAMLGDGADIGCGCILAPGCVIGKSTIVYPLTFVRGAIGGNRIVKSMENIIEREAPSQFVEG